MKKRYANIAKTGCGCSCSNATATEISKAIGCSDEDVKEIPDANIGLGCVNPTALGKIKEGDTVLDLGNGAGIDCFLAAKKIGSTGKVIDVDMTEEMVKKAAGLCVRILKEDTDISKDQYNGIALESNRNRSDKVVS